MIVPAASTQTSTYHQCVHPTGSDIQNPHSCNPLDIEDARSSYVIISGLFEQLGQLFVSDWGVSSTAKHTWLISR